MAEAAVVEDDEHPAVEVGPDGVCLQVRRVEDRRLCRVSGSAVVAGGGIGGCVGGEGAA